MLVRADGAVASTYHPGMSDLEQMPPEPIVLGPSEPVPERPFTAIDLIDRDRAILHELLADVCRLVADSVAGIRTIVPYDAMEWRVDGRAHRHIICLEDRLRSHPKLCVVGFFGERRTELDDTPLEEVNAALVAEFSRYPGITSYSSLELPGGQWANLVLHDDPVDTEYWRRSELHARAVTALSQVHYRTVRIHNGELNGPLLQDPSIVLTSTKFFDFTGEAEWRAKRAFDA